MNDILLSIVLPTKDRYPYLKSFIELIASFQQPGLELVVQDNSTDNQEFLAWLEARQHPCVKYDHVPEPLSIIENSDLAIRHSSGKYVCFMGDDDLVSKDLFAFVTHMDQYGYESAVFQKAHYSWPGVQYKIHRFPNLIVKPFSGMLKRLDVEHCLDEFLRIGATGMGKAPQLYHGVILRECLEKIYEQTGTYFPGPSPDMAVSVALTLVVQKHLYCDVPYTTAGTAPKSGGGMGAAHQHKGDISKMPWLPKDTEANWESRNPKIWTGPTIWAESGLKALRAMGAEAVVSQFNFPYSYAYLWMFYPDYQAMAIEKLQSGERLRFYLYIVKLFCMRCVIFVQNILLTRFGITRKRIGKNIADSQQAGKLLDRWIAEKQIDLDRMFASLK